MIPEEERIRVDMSDEEDGWPFFMDEGKGVEDEEEE